MKPWEETWECDLTEGQVCVYVGPTDGDAMLCLGLYEDSPRDKDVAQLIAAAPELYRELDGFLRDYLAGEVSSDTIRDVKSLLAKARGER